MKTFEQFVKERQIDEGWLGDMLGKGAAMVGSLIGGSQLLQWIATMFDPTAATASSITGAALAAGPALPFSRFLGRVFDELEDKIRRYFSKKPKLDPGAVAYATDLSTRVSTEAKVKLDTLKEKLAIIDDRMNKVLSWSLEKSGIKIGRVKLIILENQNLMIFCTKRWNMIHL